MNAQQFLEKHGKDAALAFCERVGTSFDYFLQVAAGKRTVSRKAAEKWELASAGEMDRVSLVFGSNPPPPVELAVAAQGVSDPSAAPLP